MSDGLLIVEDDVGISDALCDLLRGEGYDTECVGDLSQARRALARRVPGCMILDLNLPDGTGEDLLRELTASGQAPPTLLLSAATDAPRVANRFGIPLVTKPFDIDALLSAVELALASRTTPVDAG